jgi:hypothetical protein
MIVTEVPVIVLVIRLGLRTVFSDLGHCTGRAEAEDTEEASTRAHHCTPLTQATLQTATLASLKQP